MPDQFIGIQKNHTRLDFDFKAPDEGCTPRFEVKVEAGVVFLNADELLGHATDLTRPVAGPVSRKAMTA